MVWTSVSVAWEYQWSRSCQPWDVVWTGDSSFNSGENGWRRGLQFWPPRSLSLRDESCSFGVQDFDLDGKTTRVFDRRQAEVYRYYHSEMGTCLWNGRATKFVSFCLESVLSDVFIFLSNYGISDEFYSKKIIFLSNFYFKFVKTQTDWFLLRKVVWVAQFSQVDLQILSQKYRGMRCLVVLVHYNNMIVTINIIPLCNLHDSILWVGTVSHIRQSVVLILHYSANCNGFDIQVLNFNS